MRLSQKLANIKGVCESNPSQSRDLPPRICACSFDATRDFHCFFRTTEVCSMATCIRFTVEGSHT